MFKEQTDLISMHDFKVAEFLLRIASLKLSYVDTRSAIATIRYLPRSTGFPLGCHGITQPGSGVHLGGVLSPISTDVKSDLFKKSLAHSNEAFS